MFAWAKSFCPLPYIARYIRIQKPWDKQGLLTRAAWVLRDVAQFGSAPALGAGCRRFESCRPDHMRVWFNGRTEAFQASNAGSIPVTRSIKTPGQSLMSSGLFCLCPKMCATWGPNWGQARKTFQLLLSACHNKFCITQLFGYVSFRLVLSQSVASRQNPRCALRRGVGASRR